INSAQSDDSPNDVDAKRATPEDWPLAFLLQAVADSGANARQKLIHPERLGDVIVSADVQRSDLAGFVCAAGKHDDRNRRSRLPRPRDNIDAVDSGKAKIEHHH